MIYKITLGPNFDFERDGHLLIEQPLDAVPLLERGALAFDGTTDEGEGLSFDFSVIEQMNRALENA